MSDDLMFWPNGRPKKQRAPHRSAGYAAPPGTGPAGETCGTCRHHVVVELAGRYHKCGIGKRTGGPGTDIRVGSPACSRWERLLQDVSAPRRRPGGAR